MNGKTMKVLSALLGVTIFLVACGGGAAPAGDGEPAGATESRLTVVKDRGTLICGVNDKLPGFGYIAEGGAFAGFDVEFCQAVAAGVLGDKDAVEYRALSASERFTAVQTGEVDVLIRNTTWTLTRDTSVGLDFSPTTFYDGQGMMVRADSGIGSLEDMDGLSICVQTGTTTELNLADQFRARGLDFTPVVFEDNDTLSAAYDEGRCDGMTTDKSGLIATRASKLANPGDHVILADTMSKEPLGPTVLANDSLWLDAVNWIVYATFQAEEFGINSGNVDSFTGSSDPSITSFLGTSGELGEGMELPSDFVYQVIKQVGNYEEIYLRNLGPDTPFNVPRGLNSLWTEGGLLYSPPFR